jgi:hypothetical protein
MMLEIKFKGFKKPATPKAPDRSGMGLPEAER